MDSLQFIPGIEQAVKSAENFGAWGFGLIILIFGIAGIVTLYFYDRKRAEKREDNDRTEREKRYEEDRAEKRKFADDLLAGLNAATRELAEVRSNLAADQVAVRATLSAVSDSLAELKNTVKSHAEQLNIHHTEILIIKGKIDKGL